MATARHGRTTMVWEWNGTPWDLETAQSGCSWVTQDGGGVLAGAIRENLPSFDVRPVGRFQSTTNYNIDWAWEGTTVATPSDLILQADEAVAFATAIRAFVPNNLRLTQIRSDAYDIGGDVINGANFFTLKTPLAGLGGTSYDAPAKALVLSLVTGARGPGGRGRMYLPLCAAAPSADGTVPSATITTLNNAGKTFLENFYPQNGTPAVVNKDKGTYSGVVACRVGNHFDSQRRRINQVPETYVSVNLAF